MHLYEHQKQVIEDDLKKVGLFLGTGSGKTRIALELARGKTLVIAPKTQVEDKNWEREHKKMSQEKAMERGTYISREITTITFDIFKRCHESLKRYDTVIVDEAHGMLGVTPNTRQRNRKTIPKTSQRFEALYEYIERVKPDRLYLCTATIAKSPFTVWAASVILNRLA